MHLNFSDLIIAGSMVVSLVGFGLSESKAQDKLDYRKDIQPLLANHCFACHGFDSESREAGLRLDVREEAIDAAAIEPGDPDKSLLIERIFSDDEYEVMPPPEFHKPLSDEDKDKLRRWILEGAEYTDHWAFETIRKPDVPSTDQSGWSRNPIDHFIFDRFNAVGLEPATEVSPNLLFRRICFDLTGLPPQPQDLSEFLNDYRNDSEAALSKWIDRLQETPAWAEHQARYWLDAARYADTHGLHFDNYREMWPYRDWVIRSFLSNQPFDQFIREQIAGDLLPNPTTDQLIATGFQRCNITTNEGGTIVEENLALYAADRVQTVGWVFMGLTTNCAQCHDHKFDPISMKDYYALAAFFRNTDIPGLDGNNNEGNFEVLRLPNPEDKARLEELERLQKEIKDQRNMLVQAGRQDFRDRLDKREKASDLLKTPTANELVVHLPLNEGDAESPIVNQVEADSTFEPLKHALWKSDGKLGPAAQIDQQNSILLGDVGNWEFDQPFSFSAWIKVENPRQRGSIIARMDNENQFRGWDLMQFDNHLAVHLIDQWPQNAIKVQTARGVISTKRWHHVAFTYEGTRDPTGIKIFVDGQLQKLTVQTNSLSPEASLITSTPTRIGQRQSSEFWDGGQIQEVRLFGRSLSDREIAELTWQTELDSYFCLPEDQRQDEKLVESLYTKWLNLADENYGNLVRQEKETLEEIQQIHQRSPITHIWKERESTQPKTHILMRGEYDKLGEEVFADTPENLPPMLEEWPKNRLGLAEWLLHESNPLTARVTVNRFWQQIFGNGLVQTSEDFGVMGTPPTHPELLDWLAGEFRDQGWDVRKIYKLILMSATYRQAAVATEQKLFHDPDNLLLSRGPRFRLDGEVIRDAALYQSGLLSSKMFGPAVKPYQPENVWDSVGMREGNTRIYEQDSGEDLYRRSIYTFWKRMAPPPNLEIFNAPNREVCTVKRERTNTPLQALVTLNDLTFVEAARNLAQSILLAELADDAARMDAVAMRVLAREMTSGEQAILLEDLNFYRDYFQENSEAASELIAQGQSATNSQILPQELAAWTMVCQQIMNLDEAINK